LGLGTLLGAGNENPDGLWEGLEDGLAVLVSSSTTITTTSLVAARVASSQLLLVDSAS
jgi:hypothetical protein